MDLAGEIRWFAGSTMKGDISSLKQAAENFIAEKRIPRHPATRPLSPEQMVRRYAPEGQCPQRKADGPRL